MKTLKRNFILEGNKMDNIISKLILLFIVVFLSNKIVLSNPLNAFIDHVAPNQNAINVNKSSNIDIVFTQDMNEATINSSNVKVFGLQSGMLFSSISYNAGTKTATINPNNDFRVGEKIQVTLTSGIQTSANTPITPFTYTFTVQSLSGIADFTEASDPYAGYGIINFIIPGDFDRDGNLDLCVGHSSNNIIILKNNGTGNFNDTSNFILINNYIGSIVSLDCDNDGDLDLAVNTYSQSYDLVIYKNNGNGIFNQSSTFPGLGRSFMSQGDFDSDGDIDLVGWDDSLQILLNNGAGSFTAGPSYACECYCAFNPPVDNYFGGLITDDIDNDGSVDIIVQGNESVEHPLKCRCSYTIFFKNNGSGSFTGIDIPNTPFIYSMTSGDINNDTDIDLLRSPNSIYNNNGTGIFTLSSYPGAGGHILMSDFDSDGDLDIAEQHTSFSGDDLLNVYKNGGTGIFNLYSSKSTSLGNVGFAFGDFDGNGTIDIAATNNQIGKFSIFLNNVTTYNIKTIVEGFYNISLNTLNMNDTLKAYLKNVSSPYTIIDSGKAVIDSITFTGSFIFSHAPTGTYYIMLKHRNGLETWSAEGEPLIRGALSYYDFTSAQSQAYGGNLILKGTKWCIYSGDVDQDGFIDGTDGSSIDNDVSNFATGYLSTDLDGNNFVDASDASIADNNASNFVSVIKPPGAVPGPQTPIDKHISKKEKNQNEQKKNKDVDLKREGKNK